jgi:hypothetical protein
MTLTEMQREYEAEGGLPGKVAVGKVWRDIAVSCKCGTVDSDLVRDEPGEDVNFYAAGNEFRKMYKQCPDCGQRYRIGLGRKG